MFLTPLGRSNKTNMEKERLYGEYDLQQAQQNMR